MDSPAHSLLPSAAWTAAETPFRALIENAPDVIMVLTPSGKVIYASPSVQRVLGFDPEAAIGLSLDQVIYPEDAAKIREAHLEALANPGTPIRVPEYRVIRADGAIRWFEAVGAYVVDDPGLDGVVVNARDITERKLAQERLEKSEGIARIINNFATTLSALHSEEDILWDITRQCIASLGFADCVIYLLDESRGVLIQKAAYGPKNPRDREILSPIEIPLGTGIVGTVAVTGRPEIVSDTRLDRRYIIDDAARLSEIAIPIAAEGKVLGVIDSEHPDAGFFKPEHLGVLGAIASICANKLVRARAETRLRELNRDLEKRIAERTVDLVLANENLKREIADRIRAERVQRALLEISEAVHTTEDLQQLYERIHSIIGTLMPAQNFYLALLDEATDMISFPYYRHRVDPPPLPRKRSLGMTEYVLRKGRPVLADAAEFQRLYDLGEYRPFGEPAIIWLGVPLIVKGRTFGVMAVQDQENLNAYGEEEKRLLSFVAGQTALAIERKRTAEEYVTQTRLLRESEQRFSKAFSAIPANVSLVRLRDERCVEVNEAAMVFTGYTREEMIGHTSLELGLWVNPEDRLKFFREFTKEGRVVSMEAESRTKSGRIDTVLIAAEQIEVQGEPHILTLTVAITERKKAEEELLRSLARERELSSLKSSFVSLVSHEFRTPIGIIHSSAEILERYIDRLPLEERRDHLAAIQSHAWRMAALMEEVLVFGRAEAGRLDFRPTVFSLREVCQRWVDEMALATKRCCPIGVSFGNMPDNALGDPDLLRHVISNLLSNAVKYSPPGREVRLTVNCEDAQAVFRVIDRGLGIPAADRERLFTAFQRGANVRHLPGTGLGLVVIRHCLDLHHGTIEILSQENLGTTVTVRLPLFESRP